MRCSTAAEISRIGRPLAVTGGDEIADDPADIALLGGVIVRSGMVSGYRHRPCLVPVVEPLEELCRIGDVLGRVEHLPHRGKFCSVKMDIDLHAADIDQLGAALAGGVNQLECLRQAGGKICLPLDIDGVRAQRSLAARFRQADRIENAFRNAIPACGSLYLPLTIDP